MESKSLPRPDRFIAGKRYIFLESGDFTYHCPGLLIRILPNTQISFKKIVPRSLNVEQITLPYLLGMATFSCNKQIYKQGCQQGVSLHKNPQTFNIYIFFTAFFTSHNQFMYNVKNVAREPDDPWPTMALVKFRLYREKPTTPILFLREPCIRPHALFQGRGSNPGRATSQSAALAIRPQYDACQVSITLHWIMQRVLWHHG